MQIFDTLSNQKTELKFSDKVRIYLGGVTVYDDAHIGHARTIIVFDVLRRFLESQKIPVEFVQNFTDVDDKILERAKREGITVEELTKKYTDNYYRDFDNLNVIRATEYPVASEHIKEMQSLISNLVDKKFAYETKSGVYFSISKFSDYGKLSKKLSNEESRGEHRISVDKEKEDPADFALWKFDNESKRHWPSPWGEGRPGWHIECSAMSLKCFGEETFEIHGGGEILFSHIMKTKLLNQNLLRQNNLQKFGCMLV